MWQVLYIDPMKLHDNPIPLRNLPNHRVLLTGKPRARGAAADARILAATVDAMEPEPEPGGAVGDIER